MRCPPAYLRTVTDSDGAAILDPLHNKLITLNPTGAFVWRRLLQGHDPKDIVIALAAECNVEPGTVESGVQSFLKQLETESLFLSTTAVG